jgi:prolyl oligopeptidase
MAQGPPVAPIRNVADIHFGVRVDDPYRYMENVNDPDVAGWMKGQSDYARGILDRIPGRASLLVRMDEITQKNAIAQGGGNISGVRRLPGGRYFYLKAQPSQDQTAKLYTRQGLDGPEVLLVDPNVATMATGKPHVIDGYVPSFDGVYVAYGLSMSGAEDAVLHVIETATAKEVDAPIDRRPFAVNWRPDGRSFFYNRRQELTPGMPATQLKQRSQVFLHTIGQDAETDPVVFGIDAPPPVGRINPPDLPIVITSPASRWALAIVRDSNDGGMSLYAAPIDAVTPARIRWRVVAGDVEVRQLDHVAVRGDELFLITHSDAPRRRVIKVNLAQADLNTATTVVPQGEAVIESIAASRDAVYVVQRDGPMHQLLRVPWSGDPPRAQMIVPPAAGAVRLMPLDPRVDGALLSVGLPVRVYAYDASTGRIVDAGLLPRGLEMPTDCEIVHVKVTSHDGVLVPVSIVQRRGLPRNGSNPTILEGYGAYGNSLEANLRPPTRTWCELGGSTSLRTSAGEVSTARSGTKPATRRPSRTRGRTRSPWRSI